MLLRSRQPAKVQKLITFKLSCQWLSVVAPVCVRLSMLASHEQRCFEDI